MKDFAADRGGATAIEYAMVASLVSVGILAAVSSMGTQIKAFFTSVASNLK